MKNNQNDYLNNTNFIIKTTNNKNILNEENFLDNEDLCIICWSEIGNTLLCVNCKYKYCETCVIKVNSNCTICNRYKNKDINSFYLEYLFNENQDFEIIYELHFYTLFFSYIISSIIFFFTCIGLLFFFIFCFNLFFSFLF